MPNDIVVQVSPSASDAAVAEVNRVLERESKSGFMFPGATFQIERADPTKVINDSKSAEILTRRLLRICEALS